MCYGHLALEQPLAFSKMFLGGVQCLPPNGGNRMKDDFYFAFGLRNEQSYCTETVIGSYHNLRESIKFQLRV